MAIRRYWIGSTGPFLYEDTGRYGFDNELFRAFRTDGQMVVDAEPAVDHNVLRLSDIDGVINIVAVDDIDDPSTELASYTALRTGALLVVYEAGSPTNEYALYAYDSTATANPPTVCAGSVGYWVCIVGEHAVGGGPTDGKSVLSGAVDPTTEGVDGDFYINTTTWTIFGPKAGGVWPAGVSLVGPAGADGADGVDGVDGKTVLSGAIDPTTEGVDGDFYINTATWKVFGPKATTWPAGISIVGPSGEDGTNGTNGVDGTDGVDGADGRTLLNGVVDPTTEGADGDFYINTNTWYIFGPKATTWPAGVSLVGPTGPAGSGGSANIRLTQITIEDSGTADRIACSGSNIYNGYNIAAATALAKGATEGYFSLSADGATLTIDSSAFSGVLLMVIGIPNMVNSSGDALAVQTQIMTNTLYLTFRRNDSSKVDLTSAVDVGSIIFDISFITTS